MKAEIKKKTLGSSCSYITICIFSSLSLLFIIFPPIEKLESLTSEGDILLYNGMNLAIDVTLPEVVIELIPEATQMHSGQNIFAIADLSIISEIPIQIGEDIRTDKPVQR